MIRKSDKIYIAGHRGMVGSACWRALKARGYFNLVGRTSKELDLRDQNAVEDFISNEIIPEVSSVRKSMYYSSTRYNFEDNQNYFRCTSNSLNLISSSPSSSKGYSI